MSYIDVSNTLLDITNSTSKVQAEKAAQTAGSSELGQDAFLRLLMAQMKNQDPMNPTDSTQFLSQEAQYTQISELQKLNKNLSSSNEMMQASSLIGKNVSLTDPDNSLKKISGVVSEAIINSTGTNVVIGGKSYPLSSITSIKEATAAN